MSLSSILLGLFAPLVLNEFCDISPWAGRKLVRWAARLRYGRGSERAAIRGEELAALIDQRPGKLFKLGTALCFVFAGAAHASGRAIDRRFPWILRCRAAVWEELVWQATGRVIHRWSLGSGVERN